jgi:hypothetical protein
MCQEHAGEPALCLCTRCRRPACKRCSPNGVHCAPCLDALAEEDRRAAVRARRFGIASSLAIGIALAGGGVAAQSPKMLGCGVAVILLVAFLYGRGLWQEHKERQKGLPSAVDKQH